MSGHGDGIALTNGGVTAAYAPRQVQKSKAGTGRVVGFRELGLVNAFTIEASFCGAAVGRYAKQHYNTGEAGPE